MNGHRHARTRVPLIERHAEFARSLRAVGLADDRADAEAWERVRALAREA